MQKGPQGVVQSAGDHASRSGGHLFEFPLSLFCGHVKKKKKKKKKKFMQKDLCAVWVLTYLLK